MFLPEAATTTTWATACLAADTDIRLADGTFAPIQHSVGKKIWTDRPYPRTIIRIHKFDTLETDPPLYLIKGNWMTESHVIRGRMEPKWHRASEFRGDNVTRRATSKGPVFAVELDMDDYLTLRGGIQVATFGNCLIVEPHRLGYIQDFRFKIDQAVAPGSTLYLPATHLTHGPPPGPDDPALHMQSVFVMLMSSAERIQLDF